MKNEIFILHHPALDISFFYQGLGVVPMDDSEKVEEGKAKRIMKLETKYFTVLLSFLEITSIEAFSGYLERNSNPHFVMVHDTESSESVDFIENLKKNELFSGEDEEENENIPVRVIVLHNANTAKIERSEKKCALEATIRKDIEIIEVNEGTGTMEEASLSILNRAEPTGFARLYDLLTMTMWEESQMKEEQTLFSGETDIDVSLENIISGMRDFVSMSENSTGEEVTVSKPEGFSEQDDLVGLMPRINEFREALTSCDDNVRREAAERIAMVFGELLEMDDGSEDS